MINKSHIPLKVLMKYFVKRFYKNLAQASITRLILLKKGVDLILKVHHMSFTGHIDFII